AERPSPLTGAFAALEAFAAHSGGDRKLTDQEIAQIGATLSSAIHNIPADDQLFLPRLRDMVRERSVNVVPSMKRPLKQTDILARVVLTQQAHEAKTLPAERLKPHPAAAEFPGAVPADAPRVSRTLHIDTGVPRWHSTGLYAAPGALITVKVPPAVAGKGLRFRIGCHKDRLFHKPSWNRVPEITRVFPIDAADTSPACAFGGSVYIEVPRGSDLGTIPVTISGAVEAPYYVLGETDPQDWRDTIRKHPAPWAEMATEKVVLSVQSGDIRNLDDPESLMRTWEHVMDACADLIARPRERQSPERYVADAQISAGYLHAGYPIMAQLSHSPKLVDNEYLLNAEKPAWGFYHEMGHNHQSRDWTFGGTGEVTCNLFSLYVIDAVCGGSPSDDGRVGRAARVKRMQQYFAADPATRSKGPFTFLIMYVQLQEAFGWDAYKKVFAQYRALPAGERLKSDDEKRDQWLTRFSRTVGRNLGPFFEAWDVPTSQAARDSIADLPIWMPENFPPETGEAAE
ncbi:MAG: M60 family metallopeptidase, partial [Armatimonadota bacterium]